MERTGLTWNGLAAQLMTDSSWGDFSSRVRLTRSAGPLTVSSAMEYTFQRRHGAHWRQRLRQQISDELYRSANYTDSFGNYRRNTNLDGFNDSLVALCIQLINNGARVAIITPNYDDFLLASLDAVLASNPEWFESNSVEVFGCGIDESGDVINADSKLLAKSLRSPKALTIVYLHGFVDRPRDRSAPSSVNPPKPQVDKSTLFSCYPVVSERDYAITRANSLRVLKKAFHSRNVMLLGTGISDVPLVDALALTNPSESTGEISSQWRRFAISPVHSDLTLDNLDHVNEIRNLRLRHLGVRYIAPDYFFQSRQLLEEWRAAVQHNGTRYSSVKSSFRYGARLINWWNNWVDSPPHDLQERQSLDYLLLRDVMLAYIKQILGEAATAESLRLEVWLRWQPNERELRLWASSVGDWPDIETMRRDKIGPASKYTTTQAFVNGAVTYGSSDSSRWESFLAIPLRQMDEASGLSLQVGAVGLSSMSSQTESVINSTQKSKKTQLLRALEFAGTMISSPTHVKHRSTFIGS